MAVDPLVWSIELDCFTSVPVVETSLTALLSYMLAPSPTSASDELTMLTPEAPSSEVPERLTVPVLFSVTVELLAATAEFSSPAAVTLSIWVSLIACALCLVLVDDWSLFCPYATPKVSAEAVKIMQMVLFTMSSDVELFWVERDRTHPPDRWGTTK